jgi:hypothetical protein
MLVTAALAATLAAVGGADARRALAFKPQEVPPEVRKVGHAASEPGINPGEVPAECSHFTAADAQRLTGVPMKRIEGPPFYDHKHITPGCFYSELSPKPGAGPSSVDLSVTWMGKKETAKSSFEMLRPVRDTDSKGLDGVGEDAFWGHHSGRDYVSTMLVVRKNAFTVRLTVALVKTEPLGAMKEIVTRVLAKL